MVNHKRLFRIYREERLVVRRRGGRKRALGTRAPIGVPQPSQNLASGFSSRSHEPQRSASGVPQVSQNRESAPFLLPQLLHSNRHPPVARLTVSLI